MPDPSLSPAAGRVAVGFYGKLPACGDFVRAGLPRSFTDAWDGWLERVLPASRTLLGPAWLAAWLEAPVWRFALPAGVCGPDAALGLFLPSVDRAGRYFPLAFARVGPGVMLSGDDGGFLAVAERCGRVAIADDMPPAMLASMLATAVGGVEVLPPAAWWTEGGPRHPAGAYVLPGLPDAVEFTAMLDAGAPRHDR